MILPLWSIAALAAGLFQAWRTALQQRLRGVLSVSGAGLVRYACGLPFALLLAILYLAATHQAWPALSINYLLLAASAGLAQILGTALLIQGFSYRGFVVGTAFSKTEALLAGLGAAIFLAERLSLLAWLGIGLGIAGVMLLALEPKQSPATLLRNIAQPAALCGLGAAAMFAVTGLLVRQATALLAMQDLIAAALVTLTIVMALQTAMHGSYIVWREPGTFRAIARNLRNATLVGFLAAAGSACWFTGFATAPVALVRIVGQVEVLFTLGFAHFYLAERVARREAIALLLIAAGVILALLAGHR